MPISPYLRLGTYAIGAVTVLILMRPEKRFVVVDLSRGWPEQTLPSHAPGSWFHQWSSDAEGYSGIRLSVAQVVDAALAELSTPDWKLVRDRYTRLLEVGVSLYNGSACWTVKWIDPSGDQYLVFVDDVTGGVSHDPEIGERK